MVVLLMTRPDDAARRFVAQLPDDVRDGLQVIYAPLIAVRSLGQDIDLTGVKAVIFTSSNGVSAALGVSGSHGLLAFCVGQHTTLEAQKAGWQAVFGGATSDELIDDLSTRGLDGALLHLRGKHVRGSVSERLNAEGLNCRDQVIYDQPLQTLTNEAKLTLSSLRDVVVPIFSPRTARQFADLCPNGAKIQLIAMSEAVAEPLKPLNYKSLHICRTPDSQSMALEIGNVVKRLTRVESSRPAQ